MPDSRLRRIIIINDAKQINHCHCIAPPPLLAPVIVRLEDELLATLEEETDEELLETLDALEELLELVPPVMVI